MADGGDWRCVRFVMLIINLIIHATRLLISLMVFVFFFSFFSFFRWSSLWIATYEYENEYMIGGEISQQKTRNHHNFASAEKKIIYCTHYFIATYLNLLTDHAMPLDSLLSLAVPANINEIGPLVIRNAPSVDHLDFVTDTVPYSRRPQRWRNVVLSLK